MVGGFDEVVGQAEIKRWWHCKLGAATEFRCSLMRAINPSLDGMEGHGGDVRDSWQSAYYVTEGEFGMDGGCWCWSQGTKSSVAKQVSQRSALRFGCRPWPVRSARMDSMLLDRKILYSLRFRAPLHQDIWTMIMMR